MRVPEEAASGVAKGTLSFPAWKEGSIEPTTFEIKIVEGGSGRAVDLPAQPPEKK